MKCFVMIINFKDLSFISLAGLQSCFKGVMRFVKNITPPNFFSSSNHENFQVGCYAKKRERCQDLLIHKTELWVVAGDAAVKKAKDHS